MGGIVRPEMRGGKGRVGILLSGLWGIWTTSDSRTHSAQKRKNIVEGQLKRRGLVW